MKKKGFTIVELIAVFVILGIILAMTTPVIFDVIGFGHEKAYELNLQTLGKAARNYVFGGNVSVEPDSQVIVTIPELGEAGVITPIIDPKNRTECQGYVIITSENSTYFYYPYLKCGDNYTSDHYGRTDNIIPVITLLGESYVTIYTGDIYTDPGAIATDNIDGDITNNIVVLGMVNPKKAGIYTITYTVLDSNENEAIPATRTINVVDASAPVITVSGDNPMTVTVGSPYNDLGATALDDADGDVTSNIQIVSTVNPNVVGTYTVTYTVVDSAGNEGTAVRTVNIVDNIPPVVSFGMNGNSAYAKSRSTTVTVSDLHTGVNPDSLKRIWSTSATVPVESEFTTTFTNGETLNTPAGVTGSYYLWIYAKDTAGNTKIQRTDVFNLDNIKPVITMNGDSAITITQGTAYSDPGATAIDNIDVSVTVTVNGTADTNMPGTYTITYNATDSAGNVAVPIQRTVTVVAAQITLSYTGTTETYTVLATGTYELEVWGAQGSSSGGLGGYVKAQVPLNKDDVLTIKVGGTSGYNGGGSGAANGGGATTILKNGVVLVTGAGGGGGAGGTAGGTGTGAGGADVGAGAGSSGTSGGGGGSSPSYTYYDSCKYGDPYECVGGDKTCATSACGTYTCEDPACGAATCTAAGCGCKSCKNSTCGAATCTAAGCGNLTCPNCSACGERTLYCCLDNWCESSINFSCGPGNGTPTATPYCKSCATSACGYKTCTDASVCGYKTCISCDKCGYKTCTDASVCGYKTCETPACGYYTCQNSACGWDPCLTTENTCSGGYITNTGKPGKGGSNVVGTGVTSILNQSGVQSSNGKASISFVLQ